MPAHRFSAPEFIRLGNDLLLRQAGATKVSRNLLSRLWSSPRVKRCTQQFLRDVHGKMFEMQICGWFTEGDASCCSVMDTVQLCLINVYKFMDYSAFFMVFMTLKQTMLALTPLDLGQSIQDLGDF